MSVEVLWVIDGRLLRSKFRAFFSASESTRFTCKVKTPQYIIIDINTNPPVRGVICPDCLVDQQCRKSLPGGREIISENAVYYFCIYCKFRTFLSAPESTCFTFTFHKIILPIIIVNININPCLCVLAIFSSVSQNKITHHPYVMSRLYQMLRKWFCNEENTANEFEGWQENA